MNNNMNWIPLTQKHPEFDVPVLTCDSNEVGTVEICRLESVRYSKDQVLLDWMLGKSGYDNWYGDITHWQPLPEVPEKPTETETTN